MLPSLTETWLVLRFRDKEIAFWTSFFEVSSEFEVSSGHWWKHLLSSSNIFYFSFYHIWCLANLRRRGVAKERTKIYISRSCTTFSAWNAIVSAQDTICSHVLIYTCRRGKCIYTEPAQQTSLSPQSMKCTAPACLLLTIIPCKASVVNVSWYIIPKLR